MTQTTKPRKKSPTKKKTVVESWRNEQNQNSMSGSEIMMTNLEKRLGKDFLEDFQIILSRVRDLDESKIRVLWCHDLPNDPESIEALKNDGWKRFHKIVFVSNWQQQHYINQFNIPWSKTVVIKNAIEDIEVNLENKFDYQEDQPIRLIYHTTPHRGLGLLVPVFQKLVADEPDLNVELDVYSSFKLYGWEDRDEQFQPLYQQIKDHPKMNYHGSVPNAEVREALTKADIFAYPSVWTETSCVALIEAMSAGCLCIHPNLGALPETSAHWTFMYPFHEEPNHHAGQFYDMLRHGINIIKEQPNSLRLKLMGQKSFTDVTYTWDVRENEWRGLLDSIRNLPKEFDKSASKKTYTYEVDV